MKIKTAKKPKDLNSPDRFTQIHFTIQQKSFLKQLYSEIYHKYLACSQRAPSGKILEIGSGAGFVKDVIPHIITSDAVAYSNIDKVMDATQMDFPDQSLSCICMFGVLHHIHDTPVFFREAQRCLVPGGRLLMIEPYLGWFSRIIYQYLHHEPCDRYAENWKFESKGPVSDANIALPFLIFERDLMLFNKQFPLLHLERYAPHSPLRYWLAGGLKKWSLLPKWAYKYASWLDEKLIHFSPKFGSFVDIELVKTSC